MALWPLFQVGEIENKQIITIQSNRLQRDCMDAFRKGGGWTAKAARERLHLNWNRDDQMSGKGTTSRDHQRGDEELLGFAK